MDKLRAPESASLNQLEALGLTMAPLTGTFSMLATFSRPQTLCAPIVVCVRNSFVAPTSNETQSFPIPLQGERKGVKIKNHFS